MIKSCNYCNKEYNAKREWQTFCSPLCRMRSFHKQHQTTITESAFGEFNNPIELISISNEIINSIQVFRLCYGIYRDKTYLYIGSSVVGPSRLRGHEIISKIPRRQFDELHIWFNLTNPRELERSLINHHKPTLNSTRPCTNLIPIRPPDKIFHL